MAFSSSMVTYGRGKGIVVGIGMQTEVGKIADMLNQVEEGETPLRAKAKLFRKNSWNCLYCNMYCNFLNWNCLW